MTYLHAIVSVSYTHLVTVTPRNYPFPLRHQNALTEHYAMIGIAHMAGDYPLYYDAVNEKGLGMAGLNFPGNAVYSKVQTLSLIHILHK